VDFDKFVPKHKTRILYEPKQIVTVRIKPIDLPFIVLPLSTKALIYTEHIMPVDTQATSH
jgi:hypothetical protein